MQLNLPECKIKTRLGDDGQVQVYDRLRHKYVALTPEEWVRQRFVAYLIEVKGFPAGYMANEIGIKLNDTQRRCDTVVFDASRRPLVIVEYKAPTVALTQRVFDQIVRYNMVLQARYLIVSNGLRHYCCRIDYEANSYTFLAEIPCFKEM